MTRSVLTTATLALLAAGPAAAQQFEGVVTMTVQGGRTGEVTQMYKGGKVRMEMQGPESRGGIMLMEPGKREITMLMPSEKMYMVMDPSMMAGRNPNAAKDTAGFKVTKVGTSETIAGKACDNYLIGAKQDHEACVAKGMGFFGGMGGGGMGRGRGPGGGMPDFSAIKDMADFKDGFFPLKLSRIEGEKKAVVMEVTKIEEKPLPASLFEVPEGYTKMDMPMGMPPGARP
jgi:hypothetical protein